MSSVFVLLLTSVLILDGLVGLFQQANCHSELFTPWSMSHFGYRLSPNMLSLNRLHSKGTKTTRGEMGGAGRRAEGWNATEEEGVTGEVGREEVLPRKRLIINALNKSLCPKWNTD